MYTPYMPSKSIPELNYLIVSPVCFHCTAIALLQDKPPGTFVIRDSQSYTGAFGLAVKVEVPPMHVIQNQNKDFGMSHFFVTTFLWYSILTN